MIFHSLRCLQGDFFFFFFFPFLPKHSAQSQGSAEASLRSSLWGQHHGHNQDFLPTIRSPVSTSLNHPRFLPTRWLVRSGPAPATGTGRDFKLGAKHLENLILVPWSKSWCVQVSVFFSSSCIEVPALPLPEVIGPYLLAVRINRSTAAVQQTHHQAELWAKILLWLCGSYFLGEYVWIRAQKLGLSQGQRRRLSPRNAFDRVTLSPHLSSGEKLHLSCKLNDFT